MSMKTLTVVKCNTLAEFNIVIEYALKNKYHCYNNNASIYSYDEIRPYLMVHENGLLVRDNKYDGEPLSLLKALDWFINNPYIPKFKIGEYEVKESSDGIQVGCQFVSDKEIEQVAKLRKLIPVSKEYTWDEIKKMDGHYKPIRHNYTATIGVHNGRTFFFDSMCGVKESDQSWKGYKFIKVS